jgi:hypothetical protein
METIKQAKEQLREEWEKGTTCPCCNQRVKLYKRRITGSMAVGLIFFSNYYFDNKIDPVEYLKPINVFNKIKDTTTYNVHNLNTNFALLRYWELIEPLKEERADGSNRNGFYRITNRGYKFIAGTLEVPKLVKLYNQKTKGFDAQEMVTIKDCLGTKFNYKELMEC